MDLGNEPYMVYIYTNDSVEQQLISEINKNARGALAATNVRYEIINLDLQHEHPSYEHLKNMEEQQMPFGIIVSPDEHIRLINIPTRSDSLGADIFETFNSIVESPKQTELLQKSLSSYAVVLIIEGLNPTHNRQARAIADYSVSKIASYMHLMPKYVDSPPTVMAIEESSFDEEAFLLWSLGIDLEQDTLPVLAIIYGRGRPMGPLLRSLSGDNASLVLNALAVVGEDCECGLHPRWMQNTMIPHMWDRNTRAKVTEHLGFDPENPMVKMEVSQILSIQRHTHMYDEHFFHEDPAERFHYETPNDISDQPARIGTISPAQLAALEQGKAGQTRDVYAEDADKSQTEPPSERMLPQRPDQPSPDDTQDSANITVISLGTLGAMAALSLTAGLAIIIKTKRGVL